jgi:hypothetical protein
MAVFNNAVLYTSAVMGPATSLEELVKGFNTYLNMQPAAREKHAAEMVAKRGLAYGDLITMVALKAIYHDHMTASNVLKLMASTADVISKMSEGDRMKMLRQAEQETRVAVTTYEMLQGVSLKAKETLSSK